MCAFLSPAPSVSSTSAHRTRRLAICATSAPPQPQAQTPPKSRRDGNVKGSPTARKYRVEVRDPAKDETHIVDVPEDRYIWSYLSESGIDVPSSCRNGCCTTCAVKINEGQVDQKEALGLVKDMRARGYALLCVSYPRSDIVCTLQDEDEVYVKQFGSSFEGGGVEWGGLLPDEDH